MPALTVTVPPGRIPSDDNEVPVESRAVPIAVAGEAGVLAALDPDEVEDPVEPLVEDVELPEGFNTCSTSAEIWLLVRFKAVWLAMLAKPFAKLVSAWPMTLIRAASADVAASSFWTWLQ